MGLFSRKTDKEIIDEGRSLYIKGDLSGANLKLIKLAMKGNDEACYWVGRICLEEADKTRNEKRREQGKIYLEKGARLGNKVAAVLLKKEFGMPDSYDNKEDEKAEAEARVKAKAKVEAEAQAKVEAEKQVKKDEETRDKFEPKDLNLETIKQIFQDCMPVEGKTKKYRSIILESVDKEFSKNSDKLYFDRDKLKENKLNIMYLLGQLYAVHRGDRSLKVSDILKKYNGYLWSKEKFASVLILHLGIGIDQFSSPDAVQLSCDIFDAIEPTLSPKDPRFPIWWEQNKIKWEKQLDMEVFFAKGKDLYLSEKYEESIKVFGILAEHGHLESQYKLAVMYYNGYGTEQNDEKAFKWCLKAAEHGQMEAQEYLAFHYYYGMGVEKNLNEAFKWYKKAAEKGHKSAQFSLANMYYKGEGTVKNYEETVRWYKEAAINGSEEAQLMLAMVYEEMEGDFTMALLCAKEKDYEGAFKWYKVAAEKGHKIAQYNLAVMYYKGEGTEKNCDEAIKWYKKSAEQGYENAQKALDRILK